MRTGQSARDATGRADRLVWGAPGASPDDAHTLRDRRASPASRGRAIPALRAVLTRNSRCALVARGTRASHRSNFYSASEPHVKNRSKPQSAITIHISAIAIHICTTTDPRRTSEHASLRTTASCRTTAGGYSHSSSRCALLALPLPLILVSRYKTLLQHHLRSTECPQ